MLAASFVLAGIGRWAAIGFLQRREARLGVDPGRPWRYLWIDLGFWTLGGLLVTAWNAPNAYFTMVVKAVHQHGGVLDKFVGDAALAVFGLAECENASEDALRATLEIQEGLEELNRELGAEGYPTLRNGNGIHFGQVVAGNIGSEERLEYTVIGDAVNTASRLQDLTKEIPTTVAVSGETYERIESETRETLCYVGSCSLKGKSDEIPVYGLAREVEAAGDGKTGNDSSGGRT